MLYSGERYLDLAIFRDVPYEEVRSLLEQCAVRMVDTGEILISPKVETRALYILLYGKLAVHLHDTNSRPLAIIQVGECVGELSVIDERFATAYVKAVGPSRVLEMQNDVLWALIQIEPKIAKNLLQIFSHRMRDNTVALSESLLMQTVPDIIYRLDKDGHFVFLNDAIERLGYSSEDLVGHHFEKLIHDDDLSRVSYAFVMKQVNQGKPVFSTTPMLFDERRAANRKTTGLEVRLKRKVCSDIGTEISDIIREEIADVSCTGIQEAIALEGRNPYAGTVGIIRDITERKRLQAQVEEQKARMEAIFNTAVDAIIVIDAKGIIESMNQAAGKMFGYSEAEMLGRNISMLMSEPHCKLDDSCLVRYLENGHSKVLGQNREEVGVRRDGTCFPLEVSVSEVRLKDRVLFTAIVRDITERKEALHIIHFQANYDALTKLPNRSLFGKTLESNLAEATKQDESLALIFVDLDRFKWINDNLGHSAGDAILIESANRLKQIVGEMNLVARLGGDEFTVLLVGKIDKETVSRIARELLEQLNLPFMLHGQEVYISGSLGIAMFPNDATNSETLLRKADEAMYMSKKVGKNAYHFITGENLILKKKYAPSAPR